MDVLKLIFWVVIITIVVTIVFFAGFFLMNLYKKVSGFDFDMNIIPEKKEESQKIYDGCWKRIKSGEDEGDWVCVNVKDMTYERALEVCRHEVGHEIFAEECENNPELCFKLIEEFDNGNK